MALFVDLTKKSQAVSCILLSFSLFKECVFFQPRLPGILLQVLSPGVTVWCGVVWQWTFCVLRCLANAALLSPGSPPSHLAGEWHCSADHWSYCGQGRISCFTQCYLHYWDLSRTVFLTSCYCTCLQVLKYTHSSVERLVGCLHGSTWICL